MDMRKIVFLKMLEQEESVSWLEMSNGSQVTGPFNAKIADMKNKFANRDIVLLVPGQDVLLTQVFLPKISHSKIKQAIAFALEEQLSEDIKNLHFSVGTRSSNQEIPVAVVNKEIMKSWMQFARHFTNSKGNVIAILPDSAVIPLAENTWTIWMDQGPVLIRTAKNQAFACDAESLVDILKLKLEKAAKKPEKWVVYANNKQQALDILNGFDVPLEVNVLDNNSLRLQLDEYKKSNYINMLQNEFQPKNEIFTTKITAQVIVGLFGLWFGVLLLGNAVKYVYLNHNVNKIDQQIAQNYKTLFPESTSVISPRIRVERLLTSMRTSQTKGAFLKLVSLVGPIVKEQKGLVIQMVTYADSKAQLSVDVEDFAILDNFTQRLQRAGLVVSHSNATKAGTTIQAKIDLRMAS